MSRKNSSNGGIMITKIEIDILNHGYYVELTYLNGLSKTMAFEKWYSLSMQLENILKGEDDDKKND